MNDDQHEQMMVRLRKLEALILRQERRTIHIMEGVANVERAVKYLNQILSIAVCVFVLFAIVEIVGTENVWLVLIAAGAVIFVFLGMRWAWRRLRRSDKQETEYAVE